MFGAFEASKIFKNLECILRVLEGSRNFGNGSIRGIYIDDDTRITLKRMSWER